MDTDEITPPSEKLNQYERYGDVKEVDQIRIWNDVKQALKDFCDELNKNLSERLPIYRDMIEFKINEAKLKHFGEGLV